MNYAADVRIYGKGYSPDNQEDYEEALNYPHIKKFKRYLVAGTNQDWIDDVIDEKEGSIADRGRTDNKLAHVSIVL